MRCTGHCCRNFPLPLSPEEFQSEAANIKARTIESDRDREFVQVASMLIPLGVSSKPYSDGRVQYRYSCKNFSATGDCSIYETRPRMCSDYPYGGDCDHVTSGCTMTNGDGVTWKESSLKVINE